jgi:hypothetical protein
MFPYGSNQQSSVDAHGKEGGEHRAEGIVKVSISDDLAGLKPGEGSFRGNRQNVFERGVADAERVVLAPSPAHGPA